MGTNFQIFVSESLLGLRPQTICGGFREQNNEISVFP